MTQVMNESDYSYKEKDTVLDNYTAEDNYSWLLIFVLCRNNNYNYRITLL